jgi:helix-turn-helix protein
LGVVASRTLQAVIAENLRNLRRARHLRQDEVADLAQMRGMDWRQSTVAAVETGRREVSLAEAHILTGILNVTLADFYDTKDAVIDVAGVAVTKAQLRRMSQGKPPATIVKMRGALLEFARKRREASGAADVALARHYGVAEKNIWKAWAATLNETERKAAVSLRLNPFELGLLAFSLWGRGLSEERDRRIAETDESGDPNEAEDAASLAVRRGHVTRRLLKELRVGAKARRGAGHKKGGNQ